ncbi:MAG: Nif3-like dinuclear metal center hexameric protein [Clostridium sp.]
MKLTVKDFRGIMESIAPPILKEDYDNVGLMVGYSNQEVTSILVALDCTLEVIEEAEEKGCNLILTHHPLLFITPKSITNETLQGEKIIKLIKNNISLYSAHTNLDSVQGGLNDYVAEAIGIKNPKIINKIESNFVEGKHGIGRIGRLEENISLNELCNKVKEVFNIECLRITGDLDREISKVAIINGSGQDLFHKAKNLGAQCIITGDTTYHFVSDFKEEEICIIDPGHFGTEWPAMKQLKDVLRAKLEMKGYDGKIYLSQRCEDPYKYI